MEANKVRISNVKREILGELFSTLPLNEFNELIVTSNGREISKLVNHMTSVSLSRMLLNIDKEAFAHLFSESVNLASIRKLVMSSNKSGLRRIAEEVPSNLIFHVHSSLNLDMASKLVSSLPHEKRNYINEIINKSKVVKGNNEEHDYYLSEAYGDNLSKNVVDRIKSLEERESILEKNIIIKENDFNDRVEKHRNVILTLEKDIASKSNVLKNKENEYIKAEFELKEKIRILQDEHQKQQQERIGIKFPEFVDVAVNELKSKGVLFEAKAFRWNIQGGIALGLSILSSVLVLVYGGYQFDSAAKENIDWPFFLFLILKGLIVVSLLCAWAKYAFNIANAYVHESLKRSDRMHAINFGKFFLEVYGNEVSQTEMRQIFENWNLNSDSAFTKIKNADFSPKTIEQATQFIDAIRKVRQSEQK